MKKVVTAFLTIISVGCHHFGHPSNEGSPEVITQVMYFDLKEGGGLDLKMHEFVNLNSPTNIILSSSSSDPLIEISYSFSLVDHSPDRDLWEIVVNEGINYGTSTCSVELHKQNPTYFWRGKALNFQIKQIRNSNQGIDPTR